MPPSDALAAPSADTGAARAPDAAAISERLADFAAGLALAQVPPAVVLRAKHLILDAVGCAVAARDEEFARRMLGSTAALSGPGERRVIGKPLRLPLRDAVLANALLVHGLDYDDTHTAGVIHLSASAFPAALGLAAHLGRSGADLLAAYIVAAEVGARLASVARGGFHRTGFHPTGLVGSFACALAAGRLLGLDRAGLADAQGIALSFASGSLQFLEDGAWTKRLHPGWAAGAGIAAAYHAQGRIPAPRPAYEGRYGLYALYLTPALYAQRDEALATAGLTRRWEIDEIAVKPFAACHLLHGCADAAIALHRRGLDPARIRRVRARVPAGVVQVVCEPLPAKRRPGTDYEAKFSAPYAVACGLLRGRFALADLEPAALADPAAVALMDRIDYEIDPDSTYPRHYTGEVVVELDDGSELRAREAVNRGNAERPLSNADIEAKFFENFARTATRGEAERVRDAVLALDTLADATELETLLSLQ